MARKKIEPIEGLGTDTDKLTVQKSLPLFALWRSDLTLAEFKMLDTYLSRIDSHKPERRTVTFEKGELEEKLGVKKINNTDLKNRLKHLMGNVVEVPDSSMKRGFKLVTLFEEAEAEQDDNGLWRVKLECTAKAMKYFFNVDNLGYLRYKLRCITSLTSRYTYIMFCYIEANRYRKTWEVSLDELKKVLGCDQEELYKEFKFFNQKILKRVQSEMDEKTECRYSYTPVKKGRSVVAVRFTVATLPALEVKEPDPQMDLEEYARVNAVDLWRDALKDENGNPVFTDAEMDLIETMLYTVPPFKLPQVQPDNVNVNRYHYVDKQYRLMLLMDEKKHIAHKFNYFTKLIQADCP